MARTSHTLNYRRSSTNYSCRSYDGKEGQSYALTFLAGGQTCYVPLVSTSSAYASYLRVMYKDSEFSPAKLMPEYKATWTSVGSALDGGTTTLSSVSLDYDLIYSTGYPFNIAIGFEKYGGFVGIVTVKINGTSYSYNLTGRDGTYYYAYRENPAFIGTGSPTDNTIILYSSRATPPDDPPLGYNSYALRVAP